MILGIRSTPTATSESPREVSSCGPLSKTGLAVCPRLPFYLSSAPLSFLDSYVPLGERQVRRGDSRIMHPGQALTETIIRHDIEVRFSLNIGPGWSDSFEQVNGIVHLVRT